MFYQKNGTISLYLTSICFFSAALAIKNSTKNAIISIDIFQAKIHTVVLILFQFFFFTHSTQVRRISHECQSENQITLKMYVMLRLKIFSFANKKKETASTVEISFHSRFGRHFVCQRVYPDTLFMNNFRCFRIEN